MAHGTDVLAVHLRLHGLFCTRQKHDREDAQSKCGNTVQAVVTEGPQETSRETGGQDWQSI